jgi:hypothetical protein
VSRRTSSAERAISTLSSALACLPLDLGDHGEGALGRGRPLAVGARDEDGEKRRVETALDHAGEVHMGAARLGRVPLAEGVALVEHERGGVHVPVHHDGVVVEAEGAGPERVLGHEAGRRVRREPDGPAVGGDEGVGAGRAPLRGAGFRIPGAGREGEYDGEGEAHERHVEAREEIEN